MKNILLIIPYGSVGGMERLALTFYNHYKKQGYKVKTVKLIKLKSDIINFGNDEYHLSKKDLSSFNVVNRFLFYLNSPLRIRRIIKKERFTHSISFGDMANIFSSLTCTKEFKIGSIHSFKSIELVSNSYFHKLTKLGYKTTYKNFDKVVCISKAIKEDLLEKCGFKFPEKLEVIYNPHDIEKIESLSNEPLKNTHEEELFSKKSVLFIGRLSLEKSPWHLIKAFHDVVYSHDANLIFIGDGDKMVSEHINKLIIQYNLKDRVFFLGRKSNPFKYLKKADVLALSSHYEGTPNVIVEAIAVGTPVVASYCTDGIIELMSLTKHIVKDENVIVEAGIVTPNLYKGTLGIPADNSFIPEEKKLSEALQKIISDKNFKINLKTERAQLLKKFDVNSISKQYVTPINNTTNAI
ncbi:glycosyltransferase [Abyssalbus ytuae]|uniref:Glycosyltransferase n=1 Tax=Abyssalbus ytuae TaxID=2926907 RepID=A0A9E7D1G6_9FLAO|nr:glycosyltransferase [Abyssalbus ytuae]UOB17078.1 glycosyltransferase [Abyssalbus ytuae]